MSKPAKPLQTFRQVKLSGRSKEFLEDLAAFAEGQRQQIEAEVTGFLPNDSARAERVLRSQTDFRFFATTYFPHYVKGSESLFHTWYYDNVPKLIDAPEGKLINISAPRGEAKSTLGTQLTVIWCIVTGRKHFIPIVMDAWDQAATMLEAVKVELSENPRLAMDFPEATGRGRVWNAGVLLTANDVKVQAFGSGKKMRGLRHGPYRPGLVMLDDIENDENVRQSAQRDKTEDWVSKTVLNLGPPDGTMDVIYLNTILHYDSVANRFHRKPRWTRRKFKAIMQWPHRMDLWQQWEALFLAEASGDGLDEEAADQVGQAQLFYELHKADMELGAVVSWPSVRPLLRLMQIRAEDHHAFDCEYQNDPTNQENALFPTITHWVQPENDWVFYGASDPSLGKNNKSRDPSAHLVGGYSKARGCLDVIEAKIARMVPDRQIEVIIDLQAEYRCLVWGVESVQFQEFFRQVLIARAMARKVPVPAIPVIPHNDKNLRIEGLSPFVANGQIRIHVSLTVLIEMLKHYPEAEHDDGPDCLQILWMLVMQGAGGVPRIRIGKRKH